MERLGLGAREMMEANPGLVYLSLPGFSETDLERRDHPAWEGVVAAAMGQFTDMGLNRVLMGIEASYSPLTLASAYAAVFGALAVVLALRARLRHGRGERIEVPLAAALMEGLAYNSLWVADLPQRYQSLREREIARRRANGLPMNLAYEELQTLLDPFHKSYPCRDGRRIYLVCSSHATHPERALELLGLWDEMVQAGLPCFDPYLPRSAWPAGADCTLRALPLSQAWSDGSRAARPRYFKHGTAPSGSGCSARPAYQRRRTEQPRSGCIPSIRINPASCSRCMIGITARCANRVPSPGCRNVPGARIDRCTGADCAAALHRRGRQRGHRAETRKGEYRREPAAAVAPGVDGPRSHQCHRGPDDRRDARAFWGAGY